MCRIADCLLTVALLVPLLSCVGPEEKAALADAQRLIKETKEDPKVRKAISDWAGPERPINFEKISQLRAGQTSRAQVDCLMGPPTKIVPDGPNEVWNYLRRTKGTSIWGNAIAPRLFEPQREYTVRASLVIRNGILADYQWSTDVMETDVWSAKAGLPFNDRACETIPDGTPIEDAAKLIGEPSARVWHADGSQEIGYLYTFDKRVVVARLYFTNGKLTRKTIAVHPIGS